MMRSWLWYQPKDAYCTAERRAFINFVAGFTPPASATYMNPYREWIGAQIRGDYFGYINPGNPEMAAEMAWRDARISHIKNGIYGEMFASAMIAAAAVTDNVKDLILAGLGEVPETSRLYEDVMSVISMYDDGKTWEDVTKYIHEKWDEHTFHGWCHTISNAMICAMALLYGKGDFGKSICLAVQTGFDTDCNGATVGSVVGMMKGIDGIDEIWKAPFNDTLETTIFEVTKVKISECAKKTIEHMPK
jgi:ADP-ribosylglycohydrolase